MTNLQAKSILNDWAQIIAIFIIGLSMLNYGLLFAWPSSAIVKLTSGDYPLRITYDEASYLTVLPPIATIIASLPVCFLINRIGRKYTLLFGTIPYFIAWILIALGNSKWTFYASRLISGISDAISVCASSVYVAEITEPKVRGVWGNLLVFTLFLGIFLAYILGGYLSLQLTAYICLCMPVIQFILLFGIPESPYFLLMKNQYQEAKLSLKWLRRSEDVDTEFAAISKAVERQMQQPGSYKDIFFIKSNRRAMIAVVITRLAQQFSGMSAFLVYAQTIFERAGGNVTATTSAMICGGIQLLFSVVGAIIVDKWGRRNTLFNSAIPSIIVLTLMAVYFYLDTNTDVDLTPLLWFPLVGMIVFLIVFSMGFAIVPTLISGELFSASVKEKSMAINNIIFAALIAGTTKIFQVLSELGLYVPFAFYAFTCAALTIACYFIVPETKGKTLEEIQMEFQDKRVKPETNLFNQHAP